MEIIIYLGICLSIIFGIIYIRDSDYRYWLVLLYLLLLIYGYYNIGKKISLYALVAFILVYIFIGDKPQFKNIEHYKDHESDEKFHITSNDEDKEENADKKDNDEDTEEHVEKKENYENSEENFEKKDIEEHLEEKGIEQFGLSDKFSKLHNLIHQMEKQNKLKL
jgi:hypothetical protein